MGAKVNKSVCFEVFPERGLLLDLVRFLMAHLLRTHRRERVIRPSSSMAFSCTALPIHLSLTNFRIQNRKFGRLNGSKKGLYTTIFVQKCQCGREKRQS